MTDLERAEQALVNAHHGTRIIELSAVVGRAEQGDQLALRKELVAVFNNLVSTTNEIHVVLLQKTGYYVGPKGEGNTSVVFAPASNVLVGIRPEQIAEQSTVGNLRASVLSQKKKLGGRARKHVHQWVASHV